MISTNDYAKFHECNICNAIPYHENPICIVAGEWRPRLRVLEAMIAAFVSLRNPRFTTNNLNS